jgi:hypothetical protein
VKSVLTARRQHCRFSTPPSRLVFLGCQLPDSDASGEGFRKQDSTYKKQLSAVDLGQGVDEERIGGNAWRT